MASYKELKEKTLGINKVEESNNTDTSSSTGRSYKEIKRDALGLDNKYAEDINSYVSKYDTYTKNYMNNASSSVYGNDAKSNALNTREAYNDLVSKGNDIRNYMSNYRSSIDDDTFNKVTEMINNVRDNAWNMRTDTDNRSEYQSNFKDENEYNAYLKSVEEANKENERLLSLDTVKTEEDIAKLSESLDKNKYLNERYGLPSTISDMGYTTMAEAKEGLTKMQKDLYNATKLQTTNNLVQNAASDPQYEYYASLGNAMENPTKEDANGFLGINVFGNNVFGKDIANPVTYARDNLKASEYQPADAGDYHLSQMTDDEIKVYNYYIGKGDTENAQKYIDSIYDDLKQRFAGEQFNAMYKDNTALELAFSMVAGTEQIGSGIKGIGAAISGDTNVSVSDNEYLSGYIRNDLEGHPIAKVAYDVASNTVAQTPAILAGMALTPVAGETIAKIISASTMGAGAFGNSYKEKVNEGYATDKALTYATVNAALETGLETILGGVAGIGGKAVAPISENVKKAMQNGLKNASQRFAAEYAKEFLGEMISEFTEEGLQEILDPIVQNLIFNETDNEISWSDALYSGLIGALSAGVMSGATAPLRINNYMKEAEQYRAIEPELIEAGLSKGTDTEEYRNAMEYQQKIESGEKTNAFDIGEITRDNINDVDVTKAYKRINPYDAEVTIDGKKNQIKRFTDNGVVLSDDTEAKLDNKTEYANTHSKYVYNALNDMKVSTEAKNTFLELYKTSDLDAETFINGVYQAYSYGHNNLSEEYINSNLYKELPEAIKNTAFNLGRAASNKAIKENMNRVTKDIVTGGHIIYDTNEPIIRKNLSFKQKASLDFAGVVSKVLNVPIHIFESERDANGDLVYSKTIPGTEAVKGVKAANGWHVTNTGEIYVDINAGASGEGTMVYTIAHELTHNMRVMAEQSYQKLKNALAEELGKSGADMARLVREDIALHPDRYVGKNYDQAEEEFVARSMEGILAHTNAMEKIEALRSKDGGFINKMRNILRKIVNAMKEIYRNLDPESNEAIFVRNELKNLDRIVNLYSEGLVEAANKRDALIEANEISAYVSEDYSGVPSAQTDITSELNNKTMESPRTYLEKFMKFIITVSGKTKLFDGGKEYTTYQIMEMLDSKKAKEMKPFLDSMSDFMKKAGVKYHFIGLDDVINAEISYDEDTKRYIFSAMVKNGDYPVNFDFTTICKKRDAASFFINELLSRKDENGVPLTQKYRLSQRNLGILNEKMRASGYETACVGCFVEAKRYNAEKWATDIVSEWNSFVRANNPNAEFLINDGKDSAVSKDAKAIEIDLEAVDELLSDNKKKAAHEKYLNSIKETKEKIVAVEQVIAVDRSMVETAENDLKLATTDKEIAKINKRKEKALADIEKKNEKLVKLNDTLTKLVNSKKQESSLTPGEKAEQIVNSNAKYHKLIKMSDILTKEGIRKIAREYPELLTFIKTRYGTGTPKLTQGFTPYNSELALLPNEAKDSSMIDYLYSIAGVRLQSFSDFKVEYIFDYLQMFADAYIREFPLHAYTKEISFAKLFGKTGAKINMSVMYNIMDERYWSKYSSILESMGENLSKKNALSEIASKYAGCYVRDGKIVPLVADLDMQKYMSEVEGIDNLPVQSVPYKEAIALMNKPGYKGNIGTIGVAFGDYHLKLLLADNNIRYVIPYHSSSLPVELKELANLKYARDYTSVQNTLQISKMAYKGEAITLQRWIEKNGFDKNADGKEIIMELLRQRDSGELVFSTKKYKAGHGEFNLYTGNEGLKYTNDPKKTVENYVNDCVRNNHLPVFYEFVGDPNYYKMHFDFEVYNGKEYAPQNAVKFNFGNVNTFIKNVDSELSAINNFRAEKYTPEVVNYTIEEFKKDAEEKGDIASDYKTMNSDRYNDLAEKISSLYYSFDTYDYNDEYTGNEEIDIANALRNGDSSYIDNIREIYDDLDEDEQKVADEIFDEYEKLSSFKNMYSLREVAPIIPSSDKWVRGVTTEEAMKIYPNLWNVAAEESESRNPTQVKVTVKTYRNIYEMLNKEGFSGKILDASSGLGEGTRAGINEFGFDVDDIEPYPSEDYKPKYTDYSKLNKKYDVIISNAVLNVLPQDQRDALVVKMGELLNEGGRMYVNVRSLGEIVALQKKKDSKTGNIKNVTISDSEVAETSKGSYQKGFTKNELKSYLDDALGDDFNVELSNKFGDISAIVTKKSEAMFHDRLSDSNIDELIEDEFDSWVKETSLASLIADIIESINDKQRKPRRIDTVNKRLKSLGLEFNGTSKLSYTDERIEKYLKMYASSNQDYAQAYVTYMSPMEFLKLTTGSNEHTIERLLSETSEYGDLDMNKIGNGEMFIDIDEKKGFSDVIGHEGRHRAIMLGRAGINSFPVLVFNFDNKYSKEHHYTMRLRPQKFNREGFISKSREVYALDVVPLNRKNKDEIIRKFGSGSDADFMFSDRDSAGNKLTKEQQKYFKDSKVRDENGNLLVVYHGTVSGGFTVFDSKKSMYTDNPSVANWFSDNVEMVNEHYNVDDGFGNNQLYEVYLNMKNPLVIDAHGDGWNNIKVDDDIKNGVNYKYFNYKTGKKEVSDRLSTEDIAKYAKSKGYDGVIFNDVRDGNVNDSTSNVYAVFDSNLVKNVTNTTPTSDPDIRFSERILMGSMFSGGGTLESGLVYQMLDKEFAVEYDSKIASVYMDNHGKEHMYVGDVRDFDSKKKQNVFYLHASPVCKNFSNASHKQGESIADITTAKATSRVLEEQMPKVFTVENVKRYIGSDAYKIITDKLDALGYTWDVDVYKASDYGNPTKRERMILRAVREGELPSKPTKVSEKTSWYEATKDLFDTELKPSTLVSSKIEAIKNTPGISVSSLLKSKTPVLIYDTTKDKKINYSNADELAPTLTTKCGDARIIWNGKVYAPTPKFMGRLQGLPDNYKYPKQSTTAFKIIGNGISTELTKNVMGELIDYEYERTYGEMLYSDRLSNVAKAAKDFYGTTTNPEEASFMLRDGSYLWFRNTGNRLGLDYYDWMLKEFPDDIRTAEHLNHDDIRMVYENLGLDDDLEDNGIEEFLADGNIRMVIDRDGRGYLEIDGNPSYSQFEKIEELMTDASERNKEFILDLYSNGENRTSLKYEVGFNAKKALRDIKAYYSGEEVRESVLQYHSDREQSNRLELASALESIAKNDTDLKYIADYKSIIEKLDKMEIELAGVKAKLADNFKPGSNLTKAEMASLTERKNVLQEQILRGDKKLTKLESAKPLADMLKLQRSLSYSEAIANNKAFNAKVRERHNTAKLRSDIVNLIGQLNTYLLGNKKGKYVMIDLQKTVANALGAINLQNDRMGFAKLTKLEDLKSCYDKIKDSDDPDMLEMYDQNVSDFIEYVKGEVGDTSLIDMTPEQLNDVKDMYKMVLHMVRNANKAFKAKNAERISDIAERVSTELSNKYEEKDSSIFGMGLARRYAWGDLKPYYAFKFIGSDQFLELFENVRSGEDTYARDIEEASKFYKDVVDSYNMKNYDLDERYEFVSESGRFNLSLAQMMSVYAYSRRLQAREHLKYGGIVLNADNFFIDRSKKIPIKKEYKSTTTYKLSDANINEIVGKLDNNLKNYVDNMVQFLSWVMGEKGNEVSMALYGIKQFNEDYYFPIKSAAEYMGREAKNKDKKNNINPSLKNAGFTKALTKGANNPITLRGFNDVWAKHVVEMSNYHALTLPIEDLTRVINYNPKDENGYAKNVYVKLINTHSKECADYVNNFIDDVNGGARSDSYSSLFNKLTSLFKKGATFASMSVIVQQPSAIGRAFAYVNPRYFTGSKLDNMKHDDKWNLVKKYAPVAIIKDMGYFDTNMGQTASDYILKNEYGNGERTKAFLTDSAYRDEVLSKGAALADEYTWCAIWDACCRMTADNTTLKYGTEEFFEVVGSTFTKVIERTQVYDSVMSRSGIMRSKGDFAKIITSFMAEPTTSLNMLVDAFRDLKEKNTASGKRKIGAVLTSIIINSILVSLVYAARDDDDDKSYAEKYTQNLVENLKEGLNPLEMMPYMRDLMSLSQGYSVKRTDMSIIEDIIKSIKKLSSDNVTPYVKMENFIGSIANAFGLPVKNLMRDARGIYNIMREPFKDVDFTADDFHDAVVAGITGKDEGKYDDWYDAVSTGKNLKNVYTKYEKRGVSKSTLSGQITSHFRPIYKSASNAERAKLKGYLLNAYEMLGYKRSDKSKAIDDWLND